MFSLFDLFKPRTRAPLPSDLPDVRGVPDLGEADQTPVPDLDPEVGA